MVIFFLIFIFSICWGSFLNVVAYRLMHGGSIIFDRSSCTTCKHTLRPYHLIPVLSWTFLRGRCGFCNTSISLLYPFIELVTGCVFTMGAFFLPHVYLPAYFLFFSALLVTIRTDLETFMISRYMTLFLIPVGYVAAASGYLPLSLAESCIGSITSYLFLFSISRIYYFFTQRVGLGQGDIELLSMIGSFIGTTGWWISLMLGSLGGSLIGIAMLLFAQPDAEKIKIPFGPFLSFGALAYLFCTSFFTHIFLGN